MKFSHSRSPEGLGILALLLWLSPGFLEASQINWGNLPFTQNVSSQGIPIDETFVFELGVFTKGFTPALTNISQWSDHWHVAERVTYDASSSFVSGSYIEDDNQPPFEEGRRGYIWGYRHDPNNPKGEWILLTDPAWKWPRANPLAFPITWLMASSNSKIVGSVNALGNLTTARVEGPRPPRLSESQWRASFFSATDLQDGRISAWFSDPDGDGISNLLEMARDSHPRIPEPPDQTFTQVRRVRHSGKDYLQMHVRRRSDLALEYVVEVSSDQRSWTPALSTGGTLIRDDLNELIVRDGVALQDSSRRFIRLTVRLP